MKWWERAARTGGLGSGGLETLLKNPSGTDNGEDEWNEDAIGNGWRHGVWRGSRIARGNTASKLAGYTQGVAIDWNLRTYSVVYGSGQFEDATAETFS